MMSNTIVLIMMTVTSACASGTSSRFSAHATPPDSSSSSRVGLSTGLGVSYVRAIDIVDRINGTGYTSERASEFTSGAEFYGAVTIPLNKDWVAKLEYSYLVVGYNVATGGEFSASVHMPTVIAQYVLVDQVTYNVKGGAGLGYHFGRYSERYVTVDAMYDGSGVGFKIDFEANTAFGETFYGYLGGDARWDFIGELSDDQNQTSTTGITPTLNFFSIGAKLGFTYYF